MNTHSDEFEHQRQNRLFTVSHPNERIELDSVELLNVETQHPFD